MADNPDILQPASIEAPTNRQRLFLRYFTGILIDLVVLNLFVEYSDYVEVDSFTTSLLAALLLQVLLKLTIAIEHRVAAQFKKKPGKFWKFMRYFCAWLLIFGSKFVILEALAVFFGDKVQFGGPFHGLVVLIVVVIVMLLVEEIIVRIYRRLA
jgi:membrane protease YdiL (CAAX protease family)